MIASKALQLQPEEIQQLRNEVLWPHKSFENCILETDRLSSTFHFGVKVDGLTVATVTFQQEKSDKLKQDSSKDVSQDALQEKQYRLRAMAVRGTSELHSGRVCVLLRAVYVHPGERGRRDIDVYAWLYGVLCTLADRAVVGDRVAHASLMHAS